MKKKFSKVLCASLALLFAVVCFPSISFAEPSGGETTTKSSISIDSKDHEADETTTKKTTQKAVVDDTTTRKTSADTATRSSPVPAAAQASSSGFMVYAEYNNGEARKQLDLAKPGLIPEPTAPVREGYTFVGWYADADFTNEWNFSQDIAQDGTVIYAKWEATVAAKKYKIALEAGVGGKLSVDPSAAASGETVNISVTPDEGKMLKAGSLTINGVSTELLYFTMPAKNVTVSAQFVNAPTTTGQTNNTTKKILMAGIMAVILVIVIVCLILRYFRHRKMELYREDVPEEEWVDRSAVASDAFKDGKIVNNTEKKPATNDDDLTGDDPDD